MDKPAVVDQVVAPDLGKLRPDAGRGLLNYGIGLRLIVCIGQPQNGLLQRPFQLVGFFRSTPGLSCSRF
jgi:hypothetical protein